MPIILHVPHSSMIIPPEIHNQFILTTEGLDDEIRLMTDHYTDKLFAGDNFKDFSVIFPINRICVDPERFADEALEPM